MYNDPLLTPEENERNRQRLQDVLENSTIKLVNLSPTQSDEQFISQLMQHCSGLRAMESYEGEQTKG